MNNVHRALLFGSLLAFIWISCNGELWQLLSCLLSSRPITIGCIVCGRSPPRITAMILSRCRSGAVPLATDDALITDEPSSSRRFACLRYIIRIIAMLRLPCLERELSIGGWWWKMFLVALTTNSIKYWLNWLWDYLYEQLLQWLNEFIFSLRVWNGSDAIRLSHR